MRDQEYVSVSEVKRFLKLEQMRTAEPVEQRGRHIKMRQLEVFLEAARSASFSVAAENLGISRAAVSAAVDDLERNLGEDVRLFERDRKRISLTPSGRALLHAGQQLMNDEAETRNAVAPSATTNSGHFTLRELEVFLEAARHENLTAASRMMGLTSASVSKAVRDLERNLGGDVRLFDRDPDGARLTPVGRLLVDKGRKVLNDEAELLRVVGSKRTSVGMRAQPTNHRQNTREVLEAVEFIEHHASSEAKLAFPSVLVDELKSTLFGLGPMGETVERMALVLDLMQASVCRDEELKAMLELPGRASHVFRELHQEAEKLRMQQSSNPGRR